MNYPRQYLDQTVATGGGEKAGLKQKAIHEFFEFLGIFLYLAFFFCALTAYDIFLLRQYQVEFWNYTFAIVNALVISAGS